jgi:hypothetical protein
LVAISERRLPQGVDRSKDTAGNTERWLTGELLSLPMVIVPRYLGDFLDEVRGDLQSQARRMFELVTWVTDAGMRHHRPLSTGVMEFSLQDGSWVRAPAYGPGKPIGLRTDWGIDLDRIDWNNLVEFAAEGRSAPVGHSLIREAHSLMKEAPRSAVVLAAAAAETAVKEAITRLAPDAAFLVDQVQSPPIPKLVNSYLPQLKSRGEDPARLMPVPKHIAHSLTWLFNTRNQVVHNRRQAHFFPNLVEAILDVEDLIWILDYHGGQPWALARLSQRAHKA